MPPMGTPVCWNENRRLRRLWGVQRIRRPGRRREKAVAQAHYDGPEEEEDFRRQRYEQHPGRQPREPDLVGAAGAHLAGQVGQEHQTGATGPGLTQAIW